MLKLKQSIQTTGKPLTSIPSTMPYVQNLALMQAVWESKLEIFARGVH